MQPVQAAINSVVAGLHAEQLQKQAKKAQASHSQAVGQIAAPILNGKNHPYQNGKVDIPVLAAVVANGVHNTGQLCTHNTLTEIASLDEISEEDIMNLLKAIFKSDD